ncbi:hypothetical protein [Brevundimonas sp.]|uniref:hypothetical protein n=1 Tax=Brevundimonas sp. TaxID=1871086 RepID=UPI0028A0204F|nr:hypothetical protein [Brevundimonas sp.]
MKRLTTASALALTAALSVSGPAAAQSQPTTGPVATYWMTAQTSSGLPGMGGAGSRGFNPMAMMSGGGVHKSLTLQLQSSRTTASPHAEHLPPAALGVGPSLPLITPDTPQGQRDYDPGAPHDYGGSVRMLIYHGCGEATGAGQPVVIELSRNSASQFGALANTIRLSSPTPPSPGPGRTYGDWPNSRDSQTVPPDASLVGDHKVQGDYTPDIAFSLNGDQDFLAPLQLTGVGPNDASGLGWQSVPNARGYFALTMGANEAGDVVIWSSSDVAISPGMIPDFLSPGDLDRLIAQKVILPATTTRCPIPSAVLAASPQAMVKVTAFGGETDFTHPPRPANRREPWNIEHVVKVRFGSTATTMLGMDMSEFGADDENGGARAQERGVPAPPTVQDAARSILRGLGGLRRRN